VVISVGVYLGILLVNDNVKVDSEDVFVLLLLFSNDFIGSSYLYLYSARWNDDLS